MLPKVVIDRLLMSGLTSKHTIKLRYRAGRIEWLHARKGWRGRSLRSLQALGVI